LNIKRRGLTGRAASREKRKMLQGRRLAGGEGRILVVRLKGDDGPYATLQRNESFDDAQEKEPKGVRSSHDMTDASSRSREEECFTRERLDTVKETQSFWTEQAAAWDQNSRRTGQRFVYSRPE